MMFPPTENSVHAQMCHRALVLYRAPRHLLTHAAPPSVHAQTMAFVEVYNLCCVCTCGKSHARVQMCRSALPGPEGQAKSLPYIYTRTIHENGGTGRGDGAKQKEIGSSLRPASLNLFPESLVSHVLYLAPALLDSEGKAPQ